MKAELFTAAVSQDLQSGLSEPGTEGQRLVAFRPGKAFKSVY